MHPSASPVSFPLVLGGIDFTPVLFVSVSIKKHPRAPQIGRSCLIIETRSINIPRIDLVLISFYLALVPIPFRVTSFDLKHVVKQK